MEGTLYAIIGRLQYAGILKSEIPAEAGILLFEMPILLLKRMSSFMLAETRALVHYPTQKVLQIPGLGWYVQMLIWDQHWETTYLENQKM